MPMANGAEGDDEFAVVIKLLQKVHNSRVDGTMSKLPIVYLLDECINCMAELQTKGREQRQKNQQLEEEVQKLKAKVIE